MTDAELMLLSLLVGQMLPYGIDLINRYVASSRIRFWISVAVSLVLGIIFNFDIFHAGSLYDLLLSALTLWFSSQAAYKTYYEGSYIQYKIRRPVIPLPDVTAQPQNPQ